MVEAGGVDSARWVVYTLWRLCSRSDCCSSWERMVQAAFSLLDLGLAAMNPWIGEYTCFPFVDPLNAGPNFLAFFLLSFDLPMLFSLTSRGTT
jgi:hypothetical protein